jgi:hypothetical protein
MRILKGWPIHLMIIAGYVVAIIMTMFAPKEIIGIAYDSGGVTTSTITVPLVTALRVGLAPAIQGCNPLTDGFGLSYAPVLDNEQIVGSVGHAESTLHHFPNDAH